MFTLRSRRIGILILSLILSITLPLFAQGYPPAKAFPLKKVAGAPPYDYTEFSTWTVTGTTSHVTYTIIDYTTSQMKVKQYKLSSTGSLSSIGNDLHASKGWIGDCHSTLIPDGNAPAGSGTVLIFIPAVRDAEGTAFDLFVVGINPANGQQVIPKKNIFTIKAPAGQAIYDSQVRVKRGSFSIAVAVAIDMDKKATPYNYSYAGKVYYLELNLAGNLRGLAKMVKVPNGGILQQFSLGTPAHNGRGWLIPIYHVRLKPVNSMYGTTTGPIGSSLYILTATGATYQSIKLKFRKLFSDNQQTYYSFRSAFFLPPRQPNVVSEVDAAKFRGLPLELFFVHRNLIPESQMKLDLFTSVYGTVLINDKGKKTGSVTNIDIPEWIHQISYDPAKELRTYSDGVSNIVPSKDGRFYISQSRFLLRAKSGGYSLDDYDGEQEFNLYLFDRLTGEAEHVAWTSRTWPAVIYSLVMREINGRVAVVNTVLPFTTYKWEYYFSSFTK